jgi:NAD(P)-dependent dehydrogenase (short-subunit alcohol dehydrogenase family)
MDLKGVTALVTGANRGIGREIVLALRAAGAARIYAATRTPDAAAALVAQDPIRIVPEIVDVRKDDQVAALAARRQDVNVLVNNAGVNLYSAFLAAPALDAAREELETNYFGTLRMCRAFAPALTRSGGGAIVNMLSILARVNMPLIGSLCASKAAALSLTQGVRAELARHGVRVIGVLPGVVDTDMSRGYQGAMTPPGAVAEAIVEALKGDAEEIYPGEMAAGVFAGLASDPKAVERQFAAFLPG